MKKIIVSCLEHPFRLFFLCLLPLLLWALLPFWFLTLQKTPPMPLRWHAFWFLNGFAGLAFAGFLYTALPSWAAPFRVLPHSVISLILLILLFIHPAFAVLFWAHLASCVSLAMWRSRKSALWFLPLTLWTLALLNVLYLRQPLGLYLHLMMDVMLLAKIHVLFRVSLVLGNEALREQEALRFAPNPFERNVNSIAVIIWIAAQWLAFSPAVLSWLAWAVAASFLARLRDWHHVLLLRQSYLRFLYAIYFCCALSYGLQALSYSYFPHLYSPARHLLFVMALLGTVLLIASVVGLRHSRGVIFKIHVLSRCGWILVLLAALTRSLGFYFYPSPWTLYLIPSIALALAWLLFVLRYVPIFYRYPPQ